MPSRKTHQHLTKIALLTSLPALLALDFRLYVYFITGMAITLIPALTPDLDINARKFGVIGEWLGLKTYADLIPHRFGLRRKHWRKYRFRIWHTFAFSHIPFLGTLPRTIILMFPVGIIVLALSWFDVELVWMFLFVWLGMSYSDTWHTVADVIVSDYKEMRRGYWRRRVTKDMLRSRESWDREKAELNRKLRQPNKR